MNTDCRDNLRPESRVQPGVSRLPRWLAEPRLREKLERPAEAFARNSLSFRFAARFLPREQLSRVADVYTFCRFTDDLADTYPGGAQMRGECLDDWEELSLSVFNGRPSGLKLLDRVMGDLRAKGMDFRYPALLFEGMRMDLAPVAYKSLPDLDFYSTRVAGSVGMWLTELVGVKDATVLEHADMLGRALQLTNILRDVGEDWDRGRLYLPEDGLRAWDITPDQIGRWRRGQEKLPQRYVRMTEALLNHAESLYARSLKAVPALPKFFRPSVVSAAYIYRGIHGALRRNGCDNLTKRAHTGVVEKTWLCAKAFLHLGSLQMKAPPRSPVRWGRFRRAFPALILAFAGVLSSAGNVEADVRLDDIRRAYLAAAESKQAIPRVDSLTLELEKEALAAPDLRATALAFAGAVAMLEAKYAVWPGTKLKAVNKALPMLDSAVALAPENSDVRFLRHASTEPLPGFLKDSETVKADGEWLAREIPARANDHSNWWHERLVRHVIERGKPTPVQREALTKSTVSSGEG